MEFAEEADHLRFVIVSDTHSRWPTTIPPGDVLIHAGDFSNIGKLDEMKSFRENIDTLSHKYKVVIAGNHDITMQTDYYLEKGARFHSKLFNQPDFNAGEYALECQAVVKRPTPEPCIYYYLEDSFCTIGRDVLLYGSPWQPFFCDWAYNLPLGPCLKEKWDLIPTETDVLITHGPPHCILDECDNGYNAGCPDLLRTITERVKPRLHVFGHIHEGYGTQFDGTTLYINGSTCTLMYRPINAPIIVDLPIDKSKPAVLVST